VASPKFATNISDWLACGAGASIKPGVERSGTPGKQRRDDSSPRMRATALNLQIGEVENADVSQTITLPPAFAGC